VLEYAVLFLLARRGWGAAASWLFCAVFAAGDEWHQSFVPGRLGRLSDWVLDAAAAALPVVVKMLLRRMEKR
jgi:VanZ family protein